MSSSIAMVISLGIFIYLAGISEGQKIMWPPRPGDEGYDGSGVVTSADANKKLASIPSKDLNGAINSPFSATRWRIKNSGPPPGKRSFARELPRAKHGDRVEKMKRSFSVGHRFEKE
ncbi:PREDICTED: uncharacterized protein LOC107333382 [Acropora digitifera]|uniref:uncharacterized protein LOC107333382 n=1 Tax=Acropora digitifera TaxID=70779 RepID=UPI00077AFFF3|nr:PREDICTED: uncharacterized protein LOC107333382 [Acropora digitifera]